MKKIKRIPQKHFDLKRLQPETLIPSQQISEVIEKPIEIVKSNISKMLDSDQYQDNFQANQTFTTSWINLFPHHEDEIAQSDTFNGVKTVKTWVHGQHLLWDGVKMSK